MMMMRRCTKKMRKEGETTTDHQNHPGGLPMELWIEILVRLPAEIVIELKSVCKDLCRLIKHDREFAIKHLEHWKSLQHGTLQAIDMWRSPSLLVSFDFKEDGESMARFSILSFHNYFHRNKRYVCSAKDDYSCPSMVERYVLHSYDGLLLVQTGSKHLFVCNTLTRSLRRLPALKGYDNLRFHWNWTIAFDPSARAHVIVVVRMRGFFDANDYLIGHPLPVSCNLMQITSKRSGGGWKKVPLIQLPTKQRCMDVSITMNGKVHWLVELHKGCNRTGGISYETSILTLDVVTGESQVKGCSTMPPILKHYVFLHKYFEWDGKFYRLCNGSSHDYEIELWGLKGTTWLKQHVIIASNRFGFRNSDMKGILIEDDDKLIVHRQFGQVIMYNTTSKEWRNLTAIYPQGFKGGGHKHYAKVSKHFSSLISCCN